MTASPESLRGDLQERADGSFDGWCWAPDRPQERLVVELLVNDTPAMSMVAALFRRDLLALGCGDGRHGFSLRLPPALIPAGEECLITARERRSQRVFGRVLRAGPGRTPPVLPRVATTADVVASLWSDLATIRAAQARPSAAARMRDGLGRLAQELAGMRPLRAGLAAVDAPLLSLLLPATTPTAMLGSISALAPALADARAELILLDPGTDPEVARLPALIRNLRSLRGPAVGDAAGAVAVAAAEARGRTLVLLDPAPRRRSAASLLALARALAAAPSGLLLAAAIMDAAASLAPPLADEALRLPAPLGVLIGGARALWREIGPGDHGLADAPLLACADLALRARLLGWPWRGVQEPPDALALSAPHPAPPPGAAARLHARWGFGA